MGGRQTEQPLRSEEAVRPGEAISGGVAVARVPLAATKQASQPSAEPAVQTTIIRLTGAVLEVCEPPAKRAVHIRDDAVQRATGIPSGLDSQ